MLGISYGIYFSFSPHIGHLTGNTICMRA